MVSDMASIPHNEKPEFEYGIVDSLSANVRRVICNNPGPFTFTGTGTYIVGTGEVAVIDPGPSDQSHIDAIVRATAGEIITHILVTHTHLDHSPGCGLLKKYCDAPTYGYGPHGDGGFGADTEFEPDVLLAHNTVLQVGDLTLESVYTPGHASNHLSFYMAQEQALFCGDVVMGWSSTIVVPPDGNMKAYMASLDRLMQRDDKVYYPTHGAPLDQPQDYVRALYRHRQQRERQVVQCLEKGTINVAEMIPIIYRQLDPSMYPAAEQSLLATLDYLVEKNVVDVIGINESKTYQLKESDIHD
jgi:glyoxylase-like metal-dependent hydrolase (beta-lactamase superfamily II)